MGAPAMSGFAEPGFEAVRQAFAENFERRKELGAACCVYHRGAQIGYGYVMNQMGIRLVDPRADALRRAVHASIDG